MIYYAVVEKNEELRKPDDFFGQSRRDHPKFHAVEFHLIVLPATNIAPESP